MKNKPIYVTQPELPPLEEFLPYIEKIWGSKILTNAGPFHQQFEQALAEYLGVKHISLFSNGTIALVTALHALQVSGEVITTPYSFVATAHSLKWNGVKPVFVDIDSTTLNIDPAKIEAAITSETSAILPVHCYGNPCAIDAIGDIAKKFNLKVIYDAAHAFGVTNNGENILRCGDLSVLSFHATKVFTTFEGGAIICPDSHTKQHIDHLKNFGFVDEVTVLTTGINGKMNEMQAAFGLLQLRKIDDYISRRRCIDSLYRAALTDIKGVRLFNYLPNARSNGSYFPIFVEDQYPLTRDELYCRLKENNIFARRYFYPLISSFPMYSDLASAQPENLPVANKIADQVICLPIFPGLSEQMQNKVIEIISRS